MTTTIYQKFISKYAETFTLVERCDEDYHSIEILPTAVTDKMSQDDVFDIVDELMFWQNEKATWEE
jgi:hypothetical protein